MKKCFYRSFTMFSLLILLFEIFSIYTILTSNCNCIASFLWMFCIGSTMLIPFNSIIHLFSPKFIYLKHRIFNTLITFVLLFSDILIFYFGYYELFRKCSNLKNCFIWINGIVNLSLLFITILSIIILYIYNFNKFTNLNFPNELTNNFI